MIDSAHYASEVIFELYSKGGQYYVMTIFNGDNLLMDVCNN